MNSPIPIEFLDVNMPTIQRGIRHEYVHTTLLSLFRSDWKGRVNLIVGDSRDAYLDPWRGHSRVNIVPLSVSLDGLTPPQAAAVAFRAKYQTENRRHNNYLAHEVALSWSHGFMLEDDVTVPADWMARLARLIEMLPAGEWMLALNHGYRDRPARLAPPLVGSQGIIFSSYDLALRCVERHRAGFNPQSSACSDVAIGRCMADVLWGVNLIVHIGGISTFMARRSPAGPLRPPAVEEKA
jgi:hypothetical protein